MGERRKTTPARPVWAGAGSIGALERLAGVTDRSDFWLPFAKFADGFERGVAQLRRLAEARAAAASVRALAQEAGPDA